LSSEGSSVDGDKHILQENRSFAAMNKKMQKLQSQYLTLKQQNDLYQNLGP
jgi:hypothetical protein